MMTSLCLIILLLGPSMVMSEMYTDALSKGLLFFEAQRSGKLPTDNRVPWRHDSCMSDGSDVGIDLSRAYFDSGDHVVFGLPLSFTITMMAFGLVEYGDSYGDARDRAVDALKWGTDWLLRAHASPNELYVQMGNGATDHACWTRPEDMTMARPSYKVDSSKPGSDVAAEAAAAMAAASIVFKDSDPGYHDALVLHATQLFQFADRERGKYSDSVPEAADFYKSYSGYGDELLWAAAWLHRATSDPSYISYMTGPNSNEGQLNWKGTATELSWDDKRAAAHVLIARLLLSRQQQPGTALDQYKKGADGFVCAYVTGNTPKTVAGLPWIREWSPLQYVTTSAFVIAVYSDVLHQSNATLTCSGTVYTSDMLLGYSKRQADYILGANPLNMSYMVGVSTSFPQRVHHRAASIPQDGTKHACGEGFRFFQASTANPNVINGAIVGGPDQGDRYQDLRPNFQQSEPSTYIVAPFLGLLARLRGAPMAEPPPPASSSMPSGAPSSAPGPSAPLSTPGPPSSSLGPTPSVESLSCKCVCDGY